MITSHSTTSIYEWFCECLANLPAKLITRACQADQQISVPSDLVGTYQFSDQREITEDFASLLPYDHHKMFTILTIIDHY